MGHDAQNPGGYPRDDRRYGLSRQQVREYHMAHSPQFLIRGVYGPDAMSRREGAMADHLSYLRERTDQIRFAGPLLSRDGEPSGSYAMIDTPNRAGAERFIGEESFNKAGMFEQIDIKRFVNSMEQRQVDMTPEPDLQMFICECLDAPDAAEVRRRTGSEHHRYQSGIRDRFVAHGPILSDDAEMIIGSLFIVQVADRAAAEGLVNDEPLTQAGAFGQIRIDRWRFGNAVGGRG